MQLGNFTFKPDVCGCIIDKFTSTCNYIICVYDTAKDVCFHLFPRSVGHVAMSSKNWFGPVKGYSLLVQMTSRNLSTSSVQYVNIL
jgi:hypothetical protein